MSLRGRIHDWRAKKQERQAAKLVALTKAERAEVGRRLDELNTRTTLGQYETFAKHAGEDFGPRR